MPWTGSFHKRKNFYPLTAGVHLKVTHTQTNTHATMERTLSNDDDDDDDDDDDSFKMQVCLSIMCDLSVDTGTKVSGNMKIKVQIYHRF